MMSSLVSNQTTPRAGALAPGAKKAIIASSVGTLIEWYDYALYGAAAGLVIGPLFFPGGNSTAATLAAFATFAVGFVVRPLGGIFIAHLGDTIGRKPAMILTIVLMGFATVAVGLLPPASAIGIWAPILLVLFRALQGFGAGAELSGALTVVSEFVSPRRRGLVTGLVNGTAGGGVLLATIAFTVVIGLPKEDLMSWGWRIPFLLSAVLFFLALYIRRSLDETPEYRKAMERSGEGKKRVPFLEVFRLYPRNTIGAILLWTGHNCNNYLANAFALAYLTGTVGMDRPSALTAVIIAALSTVIMTPLMGMLGDRIGYRKVYLGSMIFCVFWAVPFFMMLSSGNLAITILALVIGYGGVTGATNGVGGALNANMFPAKYRYTGIAVGKEINAAVIAGPTPFIATALIAANGGQIWLVSLFSIACSLITIIAVIAVGKSVGDAPVHEHEASRHPAEVRV